MTKSIVIRVFNHQRLDVYRVALSVAHSVKTIRSTGRASLRDQLLRAVDSVVLNIAEGAQQISPAMARKHYRIALASAAEASAALDLFEAHPRFQDDLSRVGMMLRRLAR